LVRKLKGHFHNGENIAVMTGRYDLLNV